MKGLKIKVFLKNGYGMRGDTEISTITVEEHICYGRMRSKEKLIFKSLELDLRTEIVCKKRFIRG